MNNEQTRKLLRIIRRLALIGYPAEQPIDPRYAMALGMVAGVVDEACKAVDENRPMRVELEKRRV